MEWIIFKEWDDSVRIKLLEHLQREDFIITRGRAIYDADPRLFAHMVRFAGDAEAVLDSLKSWLTAIQQLFEEDLQRYPTLYKEYGVECYLHQEERRGRWQPQSILITPHLVRSASEGYFEVANSFLVRTGGSRFLLFVQPPELVRQLIKEDALWFSQLTEEDIVLDSTANRIFPDGFVECPYPECEGELLPTELLPPKQIAIIQQATPERQYNLFVREAASAEGFWGLWHPFLGWWWEQEGDTRLLPLWCHWQLAEEGFLSYQSHLAGYEARFIKRPEWEQFFLLIMRRGGWAIEVMRWWDRRGVVVEVETFEQDYRVAVEAHWQGLLPRLSLPGPWVAVLDAEQ
jgi:hypothetical protein